MVQDLFQGPRFGHKFGGGAHHQGEQCTKDTAASVCTKPGEKCLKKDDNGELQDVADGETGYCMVHIISFLSYGFSICFSFFFFFHLVFCFCLWLMLLFWVFFLNFYFHCEKRICRKW